jgi:hypothetical protein
MQDMNITFTDSVETATFDNADGSIKINLEWWASLDNGYKALIIVDQLEHLKAWRKRIDAIINQCVDNAINYNRAADYVINADMQGGE